MSKTKKKYYTVWRGHDPGVYQTWAECQLQIKNFPGAQYKSFTSLELAERAFEGAYEEYILTSKRLKKSPSILPSSPSSFPNLYAITVDAASSGNPGVLEYRGVDPQTKKVLFHKGPFQMGTNNVGEFLAIVHGLAFLKKQQSDRILYTDSKTAMGWVATKKCNTKLQQTPKNAPLFDLIRRAETWLHSHSYSTQIMKWDTKAWGEIPADFGRK
jgi:ribonuclease HI